MMVLWSLVEVISLTVTPNPVAGLGRTAVRNLLFSKSNPALSCKKFSPQRSKLEGKIQIEVQ